MKQMVSVVQDGHVRYYVVEDGSSDIQEVARIRVPEQFSAEQAVFLGTNLVAALGVSRPARKPEPAAQLPVVEKRPVGRPKGKGGNRGPKRRDISYERVYAAVEAAARPMLIADVCAAMGVTDTLSRKSVANRLAVMVKDGRVKATRVNGTKNVYEAVAPVAPVEVDSEHPSVPRLVEVEAPQERLYLSPSVG